MFKWRKERKKERMNEWCKDADRVGGGGNWILPGKSGETSLRRWYRSWDENMLCLVTQSCPTLANPRTVARQASLSMGFSRQEYWCGLPCPPPGDLPNPGIKPRSPALQADSLPSERPGKPKNTGVGSLSLFQVSLPNPGIEPVSPALQADSLPAELPGRCK